MEFLVSASKVFEASGDPECDALKEERSVRFQAAGGERVP